MAINQRVRDRLLVEARHRCTVCLEKAYEIHHIVEQANDGDDAEENLIVLCPNCHQQRVHRNKEFTPAQLREYKVKLKEQNEVEKRVLLNLEEIKSHLAERGATETEAALREELSEAAGLVTEERLPGLHQQIRQTSGWLAERRLLGQSAREAIEIEYEIRKQRELEKWAPVSIAAVDESGWQKADDFPAAYTFVVFLDRRPNSDWIEVFDQEYKAAFYMMKRKTHVSGNRLVMAMADSDNLQNHLDFMKQLVKSTNDRIADHVQRTKIPAIEQEKRQALEQYDTIVRLKQAVKGLKL